MEEIAMSALVRRWLPAAAALAAFAAAAGLAVPAAAAPRPHAPATARAHHAARHSHRAARHSRHGRRRSHHPAASGAHDPTLVMHAGGIRQSNGTVSGLAGVTFSVTGPDVVAPGTCTTNGSGTCDVSVTPTADTTYTVTLDSAPPGWYDNPALGVGTASLTAADGADYASLTTPTITPTTGTVDIPVATLTPDSDTSLVARGSPWAVSKNDPAQPAGCELNIAMLFDLSSSIVTPTNFLPDYLAAGQEFVRALNGTPTRVAVYTFGTDSPATSNAAGNNMTLPLTAVTTATGVNSTLITKIGGLTVQGAQFTNWDAGLRRIAAANSADTASPNHLNFVVVLTDGDPTKFLSATALPGTVLGLPVPARTRFIEVENGIFSANQLKDQRTTIIGVGIAPGEPGTPTGIQLPSIDNLISISGPGLGTEHFTPSFADLGDQLRDLVLERCEGTINVIKKVVSPTGTVEDARLGGADWEFTATRTTPALHETRTTDEETSGVSFDTGTSDARVTVTETAHPGPGFTFLPEDTTCRNITTGATVTPERMSNGFTVEPDPFGVISCTVFNRESALTITKSASPPTFTGPGQTITYTYVVKNISSVPLHDVTVEDSRLGQIDCPMTHLEPGESMTCVATHVTTQADVAAGQIPNSAFAFAETPEDQRVVSLPAEVLLEVPVTG
jgi:hypothetical protein